MEKNEDLAEPVEVEEWDGAGAMKKPKRFARRIAKKIERDFDEEEVVKGSVVLPMHTYEALREEAFDRRMSLGAVMREAIDFYFEKKVEAEEDGSKESSKKEEISELFDDCAEKEDDEIYGFEIEDENGFIEQIKARKLTGDVWTDDLLKEGAEWLKVGYDGYFTKPDPKDLLRRVSKAMGLNKDQRKVLKDAFESTEEAPEEEEGL